MQHYLTTHCKCSICGKDMWEGELFEWEQVNGDEQTTRHCFRPGTRECDIGEKIEEENTYVPNDDDTD